MADLLLRVFFGCENGLWERVWYCGCVRVVRERSMRAAGLRVQPSIIARPCQHQLIGPAVTIVIEPVAGLLPICLAIDFPSCRPGPRGCNDRLTSATLRWMPKCKSRPWYSSAVRKASSLLPIVHRATAIIVHERANRMPARGVTRAAFALLRSQRHALPSHPHQTPPERHIRPVRAARANAGLLTPVCPCRQIADRSNLACVTAAESPQSE
jgi:hypothetical protein